MALHPSLNTSLITTCIATFLFALALAVGAEDSSGKDVLGATAAYAAVLVVFSEQSFSHPLPSAELMNSVPAFYHFYSYTSFESKSICPIS